MLAILTSRQQFVLDTPNSLAIHIVLKNNCKQILEVITGGKLYPRKQQKWEVLFNSLRCLVKGMNCTRLSKEVGTVRIAKTQEKPRATYLSDKTARKKMPSGALF